MEAVEDKFSDFSSDLVKLLFAAQEPLQLRLVCRSMKARVENYPDFVLHLSPEGTQNASSIFFIRFKGKISVGSRHGWDPLRGWFPSLLDAIRQGVQVVSILPMTMNSLNLPQFSAKLNEVCLEKIQKLSISLISTTRSLSGSITALSALCHVAERVELKLEILFRRPRELLHDVVDQLRSLRGAIHLESLSIR